jgi:hypothetical protein
MARKPSVIFEASEVYWICATDTGVRVRRRDVEGRCRVPHVVSSSYPDIVPQSCVRKRIADEITVKEDNLIIKYLKVTEPNCTAINVGFAVLPSAP